MLEETTISVQQEVLCLCAGGDHHICAKEGLLSMCCRKKKLCSTHTCNNVSLESGNILSGSETLNILCETG